MGQNDRPKTQNYDNRRQPEQMGFKCAKLVSTSTTGRVSERPIAMNVAADSLVRIGAVRLPGVLTDGGGNSSMIHESARMYPNCRAGSLLDGFRLFVKRIFCLQALFLTMNEERKSPCKDHPVSVLPLPGEGRARRLKSYQKLNRHDLKVHDLTGRDAALRMNLCPS